MRAIRWLIHCKSAIAWRRRSSNSGDRVCAAERRKKFIECESGGCHGDGPPIPPAIAQSSDQSASLHFLLFGVSQEREFRACDKHPSQPAHFRYRGLLTHLACPQDRRHCRARRFRLGNSRNWHVRLGPVPALRVKPAYPRPCSAHTGVSRRHGPCKFRGFFHFGNSSEIFFQDRVSFSAAIANAFQVGSSVLPLEQGSMNQQQLKRRREKRRPSRQSTGSVQASGSCLTQSSMSRKSVRSPYSRWAQARSRGSDEAKLDTRSFPSEAARLRYMMDSGNLSDDLEENATLASLDLAIGPRDLALRASGVGARRLRPSTRSLSASERWCT